MNTIFLKKIMLGCLFVAFSLMSDENSALRIVPKNQGIKTNIQNIKNDFMGDWNALPYLQMEFIVPGVGICIRSPDLPIKLEVNFKASYIVFWYSMASSVSVLYGKRAGNGMLYAGLGGGFFAVNALSYEMKGIKFGPLANMFLGYESKGGFFDVGMDVVRSTYVHFPVEDSHISILPTIRYGWKF